MKTNYEHVDKLTGETCTDCREPDQICGAGCQPCEAAGLALRSYQYGNDSGHLAEEIADKLEQVIAKARGRG